VPSKSMFFPFTAQKKDSQASWDDIEPTNSNSLKAGGAFSTSPKALSNHYLNYFLSFFNVKNGVNNHVFGRYIWRACMVRFHLYAWWGWNLAYLNQIFCMCVSSVTVIQYQTIEPALNKLPLERLLPM
jgi:hypothetical protein